MSRPFMCKLGFGASCVSLAGGGGWELLGSYKRGRGAVSHIRIAKQHRVARHVALAAADNTSNLGHGGRMRRTAAAALLGSRTGGGGTVISRSRRLAGRPQITLPLGTVMWGILWERLGWEITLPPGGSPGKSSIGPPDLLGLRTTPGAGVPGQAD